MPFLFIKQRTFLALSAAALLLCLSGCAGTPVRPPAEPPRAPELSLLISGEPRISFDAVHMEALLTLTNPNDAGISLEDADLSLCLEGEQVLLQPVSLSDDSRNLPGGASLEIPLTLSLNYEQIYRKHPALAPLSEGAYRLEASCRFLLPDGNPGEGRAAAEGTIPLVKLPRFDFDYLYVKSLGLMGADIIIVMKSENPNPFDVNLDAFGGELKVHSLRWTELASTKQAVLPAGSVTDLGFQFRLEFLSMGRTVRDLLSRNDAQDYRLVGDMTLSSPAGTPEETALPLSFEGFVDVVHPDTTGGAHSSVKIERSIEDNLINLFGRYR